MKKVLCKSTFLMTLVLLVTLVFTFSATMSFAASAISTSSAGNNWNGVITSWANAYARADLDSPVVTTYAPGTHVTVYATIIRRAIWNNTAAWYRVSSLDSVPRYVYGSQVASASGERSQLGSTTFTRNDAGGSSQPSLTNGKVIVVSLAKQALVAYDNGQQVFTTLVTTGMPQLRTPTGTFHIFRKITNVTFTSPWPQGSPYYYSPEHVNFAMQITSGGIYLHDATWRSVFGPGTNVPHYDPQFGEITGSHGCVNLPLSSAQWLYNWATLGTTVEIVN